MAHPSDTHEAGVRTRAQLSHGEGLVPLLGMELSEVQDFDEMLARMARTSFQGRMLGRAAEVLELMFTEPHNLVVLTISGAMTVGQQGPIFADLVRSGLVHVVVGTGALLTHDVVETLGFPHFQAPPWTDEKAQELGVCRVFDSAELETSMDAFGQFVDDHWEELLPALQDGKPRGSSDFCRGVGELLLRYHPDRYGIMSACAERNVPLFIPAFTDSEMALNLQFRMVRRHRPHTLPLSDAPVVPYNGFTDLLAYTRLVEAHKTGRHCIFTIGGGVPRNWAQQVAPALDIMRMNGVDVAVPVFSRGVRICPDPPSWGHLSGCTYSEGVSWAKFASEAEGGRYAEVLADATLVLPLLVKGVLERMRKKGWKPT
jgi:deoxyhypusine synthase